MPDHDDKEYLLVLNKIGRQFGYDQAIHALIDADLKVEPGEWVAITGPSGSGKSTLLNILGCLDRPTNGSYLFDGVETVTLNEKERAGLRSQKIGFVFQSFHLLPYRSVLENVMLTEIYSNKPHQGRRDRALAEIDRVGLSHRIDFLPAKLSGGEKQRVAIARALLGSANLLLCDEPTGNLDSNTTMNLLSFFEKLNQQGLTIIIVTHDEYVAQRANRRIHIIDGLLNDMTGTEQSVPLPIAKSAGLEKKSQARSRISTRDLFNEAIAGIFARRGRMALTILGIVIGITALVATIGLSRTASNRIISQFDELAATEIIITAKPELIGFDELVIPWDAGNRLERLNGVVAAGTLSEVDVGDALVHSSPVKDPRTQTAFNFAVQAASPSLFNAVRAELKNGRFPDIGHSIREDRVAVLGASAAQRLGIVSLEQLPAIAIGDNIYLVIGIINDVARQPDLLSSVIIPEGTARHEFGLISPNSVIIETQIGAASLIAQQSPWALRPDDPSILKLEVPQEPQRVRDAVQSDLNVMFLLLGGLLLIVGAIGIGNTMLVSVIERTGEIGLRRAIGANRMHIAAQFLIESTSMGIIGGVLGTSLGILIVVIISAYQVWTPVIDPWIPLLAPLIGGVIGLASGTYPALHAARLEPVEALRN